MNDSPMGWQGILDKDEKILWQGRPDTQLVFRDLLRLETFLGVFFLAFSLFWTFGAASIVGSLPLNGATGLFAFFPFFGLPFIAVGLYLVIGHIFWDAYLRGRTWYTLTNKAAYIATQTFGKRKLKRVDREEMVSPELEDGMPGTVWFAREIRTRHSRRRSSRNFTRSSSRTHAYEVPVGFKRINEARMVYRLLRDNSAI